MIYEGMFKKNCLSCKLIKDRSITTYNTKLSKLIIIFKIIIKLYLN